MAEHGVILDKTIPALCLFFCISCNKNENGSFRILFMNSIPIQSQTNFETLLKNRAVSTGLHPLYKKWLEKSENGMTWRKKFARLADEICQRLLALRHLGVENDIHRVRRLFVYPL
jgi:hypothetical protein